MDVAFPGPNQGLVAKNAKIRCLICQRITKGKYSGWKKALDGCGVWFHKRDSTANGAGARSATCVKSMTSPTIRTRSYQARPLDIVPSRACCGIQTTSVPHVKRNSMKPYLHGRMAWARQARARARTAAKQATENKAIAEHATEYADNLWNRCSRLLDLMPRGSSEAARKVSSSGWTEIDRSVPYAGKCAMKAPRRASR